MSINNSNKGQYGAIGGDSTHRIASKNIQSRSNAPFSRIINEKMGMAASNSIKKIMVDRDRLPMRLIQ